MTNQWPGMLPMEEIQRRFVRAARDGHLALRAGTPMRMPAPNGLGDILRRGGGGSLGVSGGLTLIKNAAAFTAPSFQTTPSHRRTATGVEHFATVQRTTSRDAVHESFYPAPGEHIRPGMTQVINRQTFTHYWLISQQVSDLIREGEQEHLDDAARAYELTYKKVEDEINALAGQTFGPARTPFEATRLAEAALAARLPQQLGLDAANWARVLDRLLQQSRTRDTSQWHALSIDPPRTVGRKILHPVSTTGATRIRQVPSSRVVNY